MHRHPEPKLELFAHLGYRAEFGWSLLLALGLIGCTNAPGNEGDETGGLACDVPQLFVERCDGQICHGSVEPAADLDLVSPGVESRVSGVEGICAGLLADPANPSSSLLYTKVAGSPECGSPMPLSGDPLSEDEATCIRDWISGLLPPDDTTDDGGCTECICDPGAEETCYGGLPGTENMGICMTGTHVCANDGLSFGACEGEVRPRGEDCFTPDVDENCDGQTPECTEQWARAFGDPVGQAIRSVGVDSAGNVYSAGDFEGVVSFGGDLLVADGENADVVIAKHDHFGNPVWSQRFGDSSNQYSAKLLVDADDNIIVLGRMFGNMDFGGGVLDSNGVEDFFVVKLDGDGNHIWSRWFGGDDPDRAERMALTPEGDVVITGTFNVDVDFGGGMFTSAGLRDAVVLALDGQTGEHQWSVQIGGPGDEYGYGIDVDVDGNVIATGRFEDTIDLGQPLVSAGLRDIYVAKFDSSGALLWSNGFGGPGDDGPHDLVALPNGDFTVTGFMADTMDFGGPDLVSAGERDIFLATFDPAGDHVWSANFGDAIDQFTSPAELNIHMSLELDMSGNILLGASLLGTADFGGGPLMASDNPNVIYARFVSDGSFISNQSFGGPSSDFIGDITVSDGFVVLCGRSFASSMDFGPAGIVPMAGDTDAFIAKLQP
jgi:hypothetical protein